MIKLQSSSCPRCSGNSLSKRWIKIYIEMTMITMAVDWRRCTACRERRWRQRLEADSDVVHAPPDARTRERIPLQPLPDASTSRRAGRSAAPQRATDQDLVSKQTHEVETRLQDGTAEGALGGDEKTWLQQRSTSVVALPRPHAPVCSCNRRHTQSNNSLPCTSQSRPSSAPASSTVPSADAAFLRTTSFKFTHL